MDSPSVGSFGGFTTGSGRKLPSVNPQQLKRALQIMPDLVDLPISQETLNITTNEKANGHEASVHTENIQGTEHEQTHEHEQIFSSAAFFRPAFRRRSFVPFDVASKRNTESNVSPSVSSEDDSVRLDASQDSSAKIPTIQSQTTTPVKKSIFPDADFISIKTLERAPQEPSLPLKDSPKRPSPFSSSVDFGFGADPSKGFKTPRVSSVDEKAAVVVVGSDGPSFGFTTGSGKAVKAPSAAKVEIWRKKLLMDEDIHMPEHDLDEREKEKGKEKEEIFIEAIPSSQQQNSPILKVDEIPPHQEKSQSNTKTQETVKSLSTSPVSPSQIPASPASSFPNAQQGSHKTTPKMTPGSSKKAFKPPRAFKKTESDSISPPPSSSISKSPSPSHSSNRMDLTPPDQVSTTPSKKQSPDQNTNDKFSPVQTPSSRYQYQKQPQAPGLFAETKHSFKKEGKPQSHSFVKEEASTEPKIDTNIHQDTEFYDLSDFQILESSLPDAQRPSSPPKKKIELKMEFMNDKTLLRMGYTRSLLSINSHVAEDYKFTKAQCEECGLYTSSEFIGWKEMHVFLGGFDIDVSLITEDWVRNHYRWIVWKVASQSRRYPTQLGPGYLNPKTVLSQLHQRYQKEIYGAQRSCLKKIIEGDDSAARHMILCVSRVHFGADVKDISIEVTDGWYAMDAILDETLQQHVDLNKIYEGQKLHVSNAKLEGSGDPISPLENKGRWKIRLYANSRESNTNIFISVRRARCNDKLGFQKQPLRISLASVTADGGPVSACEVIVLRTYPAQYMETLPDGTKVFRNAIGEEFAATQFHNRKRDAIARMQTDLLQKRKKSPNAKQHMYDQLLYGEDGEASTHSLTHEELSDFHQYREKKLAEQHTAIQDFIQSDPSLERKMVPFSQIRVSDALGECGDYQKSALITIWRLGDECMDLFTEGKRYLFFNLTIGKGRTGEGNDQTLRLTLSGMNWREMPQKASSPSPLFTPRVYTPFSALGDLREFEEFDTAGIVIAATSKREIISRSGRTSFLRTIVLMDETGTKLSVDQWLGFDEACATGDLKPGTILSFSNLSFRRYDASIASFVATHGDLSVASQNPARLHLKAARAKNYQFARWNPTVVQEEIQRIAADYS